MGRLVDILCSVVVSTGLLGPAFADDVPTAAELTDEHLVAAIDAIVEALHARRHPERFWEPPQPPSGESQQQAGGTTALVVLALLSSGQSYQHPRLRDAVEFLEQLEMRGTYAVAVRAHVWALLPDAYAPRLEADARWLLERFSPRSLGWDYGREPRAAYHDNSLRQYGALGLWEAAKRGVPVPPRLWQALEHAMLQEQRPDGGWNYRGDDKPPRGSMTCAGLTVLFVAQDLLHAAERAAIDERRRPAAYEQAIERGLEWMDRRFSPTEHPGSPAYFYYYLYGVERVALASGYRTFGGRDWFREGAAELLRRLCRWDADRGVVTVRESRSIDDRDLAFALLFLSRGRVPVAVNKLRGDELAWNNRPRDAANLVRWLSDRTERGLSWQIVDIAGDPRRWLDAPVLYLASHRGLPWLEASASGDDAARSALEKLRTYLDAGGLLLAVAEGSGRPFAASIEAIGRHLYPQLEWRTLPDDHWVYTLHERIPPRRRVRALGNGVRELILLVPSGDLPRTLQTSQERREDDVRLLANAYFHASELDRPRPRLGRGPQAAAAESPPGLGAYTIVRATGERSWHPEPEALPALARWLDATRAVRVEILDHPLAGIDQLEPAPSLVVVSGVAASAWSEPQRRAVGAYLQRGGTILFETVGGIGDFASAAERMTRTLVGGEATLLSETPLVTGDGLPDGARLTRIAYRPFALTRLGARETAPRLRGVTVDGAPRILLSDEDLSHALLDQPCWGVSGYSTPDARHLLWNILQHAGRLSRSSPE